MTAEIDALGRGTAPVVAAGDRFAATFRLSVYGRHAADANVR